MRRGREIVLAGAGLAAVGLLCWFFGTADLVAALRRATPLYLLVYLVCAVCVLGGLALRWRLVAAAVGSRPPLWRLMLARVAGDAVGVLVPSAKVAGDPVRAALVYRHGQSGTRTGAGVAIDRAIEMVSNSLCGVAYATVFSLAHVGDRVERPIVLLLGILLLLLTAVLIPIAMLHRGRRPLAPLYRPALARRFPRLGRGMEIVRETEDHLIGFFRQHPGVFIRGMILSLLIEGVQILEIGFLFRSFGIALEIPTLLMVLLASGLARVVPTPASLGALETGEVAVLAAASGRADLGFVVGMVMRLHDILWIAVGLLVLWAEGLSLPRAAAEAGSATLVEARRAGSES